MDSILLVTKVYSMWSTQLHLGLQDQGPCFLVGGFLPIWIIFVKLDHFHKVRGEHKQYLKKSTTNFFSATLSRSSTLHSFTVSSRFRLWPVLYLVALGRKKPMMKEISTWEYSPKMVKQRWNTGLNYQPTIAFSRTKATKNITFSNCLSILLHV